MIEKKKFLKNEKSLRKKSSEVWMNYPIRIRKICKQSQLNMNSDSKKAPTIVASGRGKIAKQILELAEDNKIPMVEDASLSKLLSSLKIKSEIPPKLFKVIAEILAFIFYLEKMAKKKSGLRSRFKRLKK